MKFLPWICAISLCTVGCGQKPATPNRFATQATGPSGYDDYAIPPEMIKFLDQAESNSPLDDDLLSLQFTSRDGQPIVLKDIAPGKSVVLVMTRGYTGSICPYCSTQVSRMIANYAEFENRNAQVVVVYPLEKPDDTSKSEDFVNRAVSMLATKKPVPFPILLDVELKSVDALALRKDLSKPATYILDPEGRLQFAYVGNTLADRPSVQALIEQLDKINKLGQRS